MSDEPIVGEPSHGHHDVSTYPVAEPLEYEVGRRTGISTEEGLELFEERFLDPEIRFPIEEFRVCDIDLEAGCYRLTFTPHHGDVRYRGTLRVERAPDEVVISGDLYRFRDVPRVAFPLDPLEVVQQTKWLERIRLPIDPERLLHPLWTPDIPVYPRDRYHSYLEATAIEQSPFLTRGSCELTLTLDEYQYIAPPAGSFDGDFPSSPDRTLTAELSPASAPAGYPGPHFEGTVREGASRLGSMELTWVSDSFRRATLEVHSLEDAVAPAAVTDPSGTGTEDFSTMFETAGWDLDVQTGETDIETPSGVDPDSCWSSADLHDLLTSVASGTDLDREWRLHLLAVPATMNCGRGVMFDQTGAHREGVATFSDDGYPTSPTRDWGSAEGKEQRQVPRAFIRSAGHEVGHGFNQQHQGLVSYGEPGTDNSIMTTSPGVADVLDAAGDTFPDDIDLAFNDHTRHHLIHFPDPVVRPGAMSWASGHATSVPEADADRAVVGADTLALTLEAHHQRLALGEPLEIELSLENVGDEAIPVPTDLRPAAQHTRVSVTGPNRGDGGSAEARPMPSFVIQTERTAVEPLAPGESRTAAATVFWSSNGFGFEAPGRYTVDVEVVWNHAGLPYLVREQLEVWVAYPTSRADDRIANLLLDEEVGKFVALGGRATHLKRGLDRILEAVDEDEDNSACTCLLNYPAVEA